METLSDGLCMAAPCFACCSVTVFRMREAAPAFAGMTFLKAVLTLQTEKAV